MQNLFKIVETYEQRQAIFSYLTRQRKYHFGLINIETPEKTMATIFIHICKKWGRKGYNHYQIDFYKTKWDFSELGRDYFALKGYACGQCMLKLDIKKGEEEVLLERAFTELLLAPEYCFEEIKLK